LLLHSSKLFNAMIVVQSHYTFEWIFKSFFFVVSFYYFRWLTWDEADAIDWISFTCRKTSVRIGRRLKNTTIGSCFIIFLILFVQLIMRVERDKHKTYLKISWTWEREIYYYDEYKRAIEVNKKKSIILYALVW